MGPVAIVAALGQAVLEGPQALMPAFSSSSAMAAAQLHIMSMNMPLTQGIGFLVAPLLLGLAAGASAASFTALRGATAQWTFNFANVGDGDFFKPLIVTRLRAELITLVHANRSIADAVFHLVADFHAAFLDPEANSAAFSQPNHDGSFPPDFDAYLNELGQTRPPSVLLAFAPKAAGTYLRSAAIAAVGGQLVRTVHAQGGCDASFYLPTFLMYYAGGFPAEPLVTHVHMQALPANRHFIEALD